jgi:hypothetical protein
VYYLWWELRKTRRVLDKIDSQYRTEIVQLRKGNKHDEAKQVTERWQVERDMADDEYQSVVSRRMVHRARKLEIPYPEPLPQTPFDDAESFKRYWYTSPATGDTYLKLRGRAILLEAIRKEENAKRDKWFRWIGPLTGIIGTIIGLVSVLGNFFWTKR